MQKDVREKIVVCTLVGVGVLSLCIPLSSAVRGVGRLIDQKIYDQGHGETVPMQMPSLEEHNKVRVMAFDGLTAPQEKIINI